MRSSPTLRRRALCVLALACFLCACSPEEPSGSLSPLPSVPVVSSIPESSAESAEPPESSGGESSGPESSQAGSAPESGAESAAAPIELIPVRTAAVIPLYGQPGGSPIGELAAGQKLEVSPTEDPLWYAVADPNEGLSSFLYGEELYREGGDGKASSRTLFQEYAEEKLAALRQQFPEGMYWNHEEELPYGQESPLSVTSEPCDHDAYGELYCNFYNGATARLYPDSTICQCLGFASYLSDSLFTQAAPFHVFYEYDRLRVGDHIRLYEYEHSMTVVEKTEDYVTVAEVNQNYLDCRIGWTRQLSRWDLDDLSWDLQYISRYPLCPGENGGFEAWDPDSAR